MLAWTPRYIFRTAVNYFLRTTLDVHETIDFPGLLALLLFYFPIAPLPLNISQTDLWRFVPRRVFLIDFCSVCCSLSRWSSLGNRCGVLAFF